MAKTNFEEWKNKLTAKEFLDMNMSREKCDRCPAKVPCWAAPGGRDCRRNFYAWAKQRCYED